MISAYHRPTDLKAALDLLGREQPLTIPIGGGSAFERRYPEPVDVVDLQALGLNVLKQQGNFLECGATATLEALRLQASLQPGLKQAIELEASHNLRQVASIAGSLVACDGRSPFAAAMLALDLQLELLPGEEKVSLGDLLPLRSERLKGKLICAARFPLNVHLAFQYTARTPADQPIVCAALAQWPSGRTRLALGGYGDAPMLAMDGPEPGGVQEAARNAYVNAGDEWASAAYRQDVAGVLALRCLEGASLA